MSAPERREIGVIAEWQAVDSAWTDHRWRVTAVLPGPADAPAWTVLEQTAGLRRYFAGNAELLLYPLETDTLKANIDGPEPCVYVFLRRSGPAPGMALLGATVCVGEAGAHADTGSDIVEAVPMPPAIVEWVAGFVARHHQERPGFRRRRERWSRPAAGGRGARPQAQPDLVGETEDE